MLPPLLALSANSPFLDGQDTGLHSVRTEIFTRTFPRCGVHEPFGDWATYADFIDLLDRDRADRRVDPAVVERAPAPRLRHGRAADLRRADARRGGVQPRGADHGLHRPVGARLRRRPARRPPLRQREIEENLWQAIRHGLDGDPDRLRRRAEVIETPAALERLLEWTAPARDALGLDVELPGRNGAQRGRGGSRRARARPTSTARRSRRRAAPTLAGERRRSDVERRSERRSEPTEPSPAPSSRPSRGGAAAALEEQLRQVRVQDLLLESVVSILNLAARRIGKADERDLEQGRVGIEAVRAVVDLLEPGPREQVREALSQVQMLYAREAGRRRAARGAAARPARAGPRAGRRSDAAPRRPRAASAAVDAAWLVVTPTRLAKVPAPRGRTMPGRFC